jgi:hypothetical protein
VKFGVLYKILLISREFLENILGDSHTLLNGITDFLSVLSMFREPSDTTFLHVRPLGSLSFIKISAAKEIFYLKTKRKIFPIFCIFHIWIKFVSGDVLEID